MISLAADPAGNRLFGGDAYCHTVVEIDTASGKVTTLAGSPANRVFAPGPGKTAGINYPSDLAYDPAGRVLYITDSRENIILKLTDPGAARDAGAQDRDTADGRTL